MTSKTCFLFPDFFRLCLLSWMLW